MDTVSIWSSKAEKYAKYRWGYAPQAIQAILDITNISCESTLADIGSGTGILTKHFLGKVKIIFAIEPNPQMRQIAIKALEQHSAFRSIDGYSDATTLPDQSVDLIIVGEALHWFVPETTKNEFKRILKPRGWLAILKNNGTDKELGEALKEICIEKNGWNAPLERPSSVPINYYYDNQDPMKLMFSQLYQETFEEFVGALSSTSNAPDEDNPLYINFENLAKRIFDRYKSEDKINISYSTELFLGQINI